MITMLGLSAYVSIYLQLHRAHLVPHIGRTSQVHRLEIQKDVRSASPGGSTTHPLGSEGFANDSRDAKSMKRHNWVIGPYKEQEHEGGDGIKQHSTGPLQRRLPAAEDQKQN